MLLCMPDLPKILLLNMDCLFFPFLFSNSMPKILYPKPTKTVKKSQIVERGGWLVLRQLAFRIKT